MPSAPPNPARPTLWPAFFTIGMALWFGFLGWNSSLLPRASFSVTANAQLVGVTRHGQLAITVIDAGRARLAGLADLEGPVQLWEIETGRLKSSFLDGESLGGYTTGSVVASRDGKVVAVNCKRSLKLVDPDSGQIIKEFKANENEGDLRPVAVSPFGRYVAYLRTQPDRLIVHDRQSDEDSIAVPGGNMAAFADLDSPVAIGVKRQVFDESRGSLLRTFSQVELWDLDTGKQTRRLPEVQGGITQLEFLPDSTLAMVIHDDGSSYLRSKFAPSHLRLWHADGDADEVIPEVEGFAAFGSKLLYSDRSLALRLIDRTTAQVDVTFRSPGFPQFFPGDPPTIVSSIGNQVEIWDVPPRRTLGWYLKNMWGVALFGSIGLVEAISYWRRSRTATPVDQSFAVPNASA